MAGGCREYIEGKEDLRTSVENIWKVGVNPRVSGVFFKVVVQAVHIFGAETWVVTPHTGQSLVGFPTQGISMNHLEEALEVIGRELGISISGDGNTGSRV